MTRRNDNDEDDYDESTSSDTLIENHAVRIEEPVSESKGEDTQNGGSSSHASSSIKLGQDESEAVQTSKRLVYLILGIFAMGSAAATWFYVRTEEQNAFQVKYQTFAYGLIRGAEQNVQGILGQLQTMSTSITSDVHAIQQSWPLVYVQDFDERASETKLLVASDMIMLAPLVPALELPAWNTFAQQHERWHQDGELTVYSGTPFSPSTVYAYNGDDGTSADSQDIPGPTAPSILAPIWQHGPQTTNFDLVNLDLHSHPDAQQVLEQVLEQRASKVSHIITDLSFVQGYTTATTRQTNNKDNANDDYPRSFLVQPIYESFQDTSTTTIVGFLLAIESWI